MMKAYYSFLALSGYDDKCESYIEFAAGIEENVVESGKKSATQENSDTLRGAIIKGLKDSAAKMTSEMLKEKAPADIIDNEIIPALDIVGKGYEEKKVFLPQLLMSAEAAKAAFEVLKNRLAENKGSERKRCKFVIATVKGDIHDIGKNIVKVMLENYDFDVIDLGKDADPYLVAETAQKENAPIVGLSALMTTTVPAMEETIKLVREKAPQCKIVVGGAVLTEDYAKMVGADKYAADAMETVRYAETVDSGISGK